MSKLDETDLGIIKLLRQDGRATNKLIAQSLGVSEPTIAARIKSLVEDKVIRITAQRSIFDNPSNGIVSLVELFVDDMADLPSVVETLRDLDPVIIAYETLRRPEIVCHVRSHSHQELSEIFRQLTLRLPQVSKMNVLPVIQMWRYSPEYGQLDMLADDVAPSEDIGEQLINLLQQDGRQTSRTLAKKLGLSESAVRQRLGKLEQSKDVRIGVVCDPVAMNYRVWADVRILIKPSHLQAASQSLVDVGNLPLVANISGDANLAMFLFAETFEELDQFVRTRIRTLPGLIDFTLMRVSAIHKHNYNLILMK